MLSMSQLLECMACAMRHSFTQLCSRDAQRDTVRDSHEWCAYWDTVFDPNESSATQFDWYVFHGRTLLRHSSWPKWIACVLRHSSWLKRKYWDTVWLKGIPWILGARNTETQFVTHMNGVCTETHFSTQMNTRGAQQWDTVRDSNEWWVYWK